MRSRLFASLLCCAAAGIAAPDRSLAEDTRPGPTAEIEQGIVRGTSSDGIERYLGIPYAAPPTGTLRWKAPQPADGWQGVRDAGSFGPICAQSRAPDVAGPAMSEDCLTLNIWASAGREEALPVMVWIHGGGYQFGSGSRPTFDGTAFAEKGIVLVTINYRLGALGFMAHPELTAEAPYGSSGNYGILDQIAALRWVQQNIAAFGGDPGNVTIFGESAGAGAVNILQASPLAEGLFHKAIGESTSQMDPDGGLIGRQDLNSAGEYGLAFADKLGAESIAEMRALPLEDILSAFTFFWPTERDGYVLPDLVYNIFAEGRQNDVPTLVGSNSYEGSTIRMEWVRPDEQERAEFDGFYEGAEDKLAQSATDAVQWQMRSWAELQSRTGEEDAWLYWFDKAWPGKREQGAFHGGEMVYVFQTLESEDQPWTDEDRRLSELMASYWANFARQGDPNRPGLPRWPAYDPDEPRLMELSPDPKVIETPRADVQQFLDGYFAKRR